MLEPLQISLLAPAGGDVRPEGPQHARRQGESGPSQGCFVALSMLEPLPGRPRSGLRPDLGRPGLTKNICTSLMPEPAGADERGGMPDVRGSLGRQPSEPFPP